MDWSEMLEGWPELVSMTTVQGVYTYVSPAVRSVLGYLPEEVVGRHAADFLHPDDVGQLSRHTEELRRTGSAPVITVRVRRADGSYARLETTAITGEEDGRQYVLTAGRDVSERIERERRLALAEARYRALLDVLPVGVLLLGADGLVESVNSEATRLLGRSAAGLVGRPLPAALLPEALNAEALNAEALPSQVPTGAGATGVDVEGAAPDWWVTWPDRAGSPDRVLLVQRRPLRRHGEQTASATAVLLSGAPPSGLVDPFGTSLPAAAGADPHGARRGRRAVDLTPRERDVLALLADGRGVREIAGLLQVQVSTVRGYVKAILGKFGVHSQLQAVVLASRQGLLPVHAAGKN